VDQARNGTWKIRWSEGGRRRTRGGYAARDDAERVLAKVLADLAQILGHYSVIVTERYAHLRPDLIPVSDLGTISLDMSPKPRDQPTPTSTRELKGIQAPDPDI
jgi:hypothetical protein